MDDNDIEDRLNNQLNGVEEDDIEDVELPEDGEPEDDEEENIDDPGEDEEDGELDAEAETPSRRKPETRAQARIRRLTEERTADRARFDQMERELATLRQAQQQPAPERETAAQRTERFALMTPEERTEARLDEVLRASQQSNAQTQFQAQDMADKMAYDLKAASNPTYARYAAEVDKRLGEMRAKGQNVSREALLKYVVGERALERKASPALKKAQKAAKDRVDRERTRPLNARGDRPGQRQKPGKTPRERLEGVQI